MADQQCRGRTSEAETPTSDAPLPIGVLASLIWQHSSRIRDARHQAGGHARCPARQAPYGEGSPREPAFRDLCRQDGCADVVHDLIARCLDRLGTVAIEEIADVERYANRLVANEVSDWERRERVARGGPAKPARADGMPARVNAEIAATAEPAQTAWLLALFRMIRAYPHRLEPHSGLWPLDGWTAEKSTLAGGMRVLGSAAARSEISRDIDWVLRIATAAAGQQWVQATIVEPMSRRRPQPASTHVRDPFCLEDTALARLVARDFHTRRAAGVATRSALAAATERYLGCAPEATAYDECLHLIAVVGAS